MIVIQIIVLFVCCLELFQAFLPRSSWVPESKTRRLVHLCSGRRWKQANKLFGSAGSENALQNDLTRQPKRNDRIVVPVDAGPNGEPLLDTIIFTPISKNKLKKRLTSYVTKCEDGKEIHMYVRLAKRILQQTRDAKRVTNFKFLLLLSFVYFALDHLVFQIADYDHAQFSSFTITEAKLKSADSKGREILEKINSTQHMTLRAFDEEGLWYKLKLEDVWNVKKHRSKMFLQSLNGLDVLQVGEFFVLFEDIVSFVHNVEELCKMF